MEILHGMLRQWTTVQSVMSFHDETTAQRVMKLSAIHEVFSTDMSPAQYSALLERITADVQLLVEEDFYAGNNNHGMFQNWALLAAKALVPEAVTDQGTESLALTRLADYFETCFTIEGVHVENSPSYHLLVSRYLKRFVDYVKASGAAFKIDRFEKIIRDAETHAAYCVTPAGAFAPISDTSHVVLRASEIGRTYPGETFLGAVTFGDQGKIPQSRAYVAEKSGYAIHREDFTSKKSSYVLFSAAYNADYHKHSDELSLYVMVDGCEILRESGPFGYDRSSPFTAYGFSSDAHNTMLVDRSGLPRIDRTSHETTLSNHGAGADALDVEGVTKRFRGVEWRRRVRVGPAGAREPIRIQDSVQADREREFTFLWHFAAGLSLQHEGDSLVARDTEGPLARLLWRTREKLELDIITGQMEPRVQGWEFPEMGKHVPSPVAEVSVKGVNVSIDWRLEPFSRSRLRTFTKRSIATLLMRIRRAP